MSFKPLRIGVLGAANIARAFTAGCKQSELVSVEAVASRGLDKAKAFAAEIGIPRAVGSYEALLADADIAIGIRKVRHQSDFLCDPALLKQLQR